MAEIGMQDVSGEVQSPTVAGIIEALSHISESLDMKAEKLENVELSPVLGLDQSDPRRIYQAPGGSRIWLNYPEPTIYLNNAPILSGQYQYIIDYIGGSVTFKGEFRPNSGDVLSASFTHIKSTPSHFGGCELKITFSAAFSGMAFTVSSSSGESYSDVVPPSLVAYVNVKYTNTEYTISVVDASGKPNITTITTGQYYGQYETTVNSFVATITVTSIPGATITATDSSHAIITQVAGEDGRAEIIVGSADNYTITSVYNRVNSDTKVVNVSEDEGRYDVTLSFITLLVTVESGSTVQVKNGPTTFSDTSDGSVLFYLPNTGVWTVTANKDFDSAQSSINVLSYERYTVKLIYVKSELKDNDWDTIREASELGQASSYFEVGDTKDIVLNGTVGILRLSNFTVSVFILGFDHNASLEGNNRIHFAIGKIGENMISLCDSNHLGYASSGFVMNTHSTKSGGWASSYMRNTVLGNSGTPSSPSSNSLMAALPADLRAVMQSVKKYTDNVGTSSSSSSAITATTDYIWLLAATELYGGNPDSVNSNEHSKQSQYDYFKSGNSKTAYKHDNLGSVGLYWFRSPSYSGGKDFCLNFFSDTLGYELANVSMGILSCFAV